MLEYIEFKHMAFTGSNSYWCLSKCVEKKLDDKTVRGTQRQFSENICSEDALRSRTVFGTFVVRFLACLPLLGFSNI